MPLNVSFDSTVNAAQQAAVQVVVDFFNVHFTDPVTIDINVSFGNIGGLGASFYPLLTHTFSDITTALANDSTSADDAIAVASLPGADPVTGTNIWTMTSAEQMALGLMPDNGTTSDGSVRFSDTFAFDYDRTDGITPGAFDFFGIVAHEFTEVMGRELNAAGNLVAFGPGVHPLDLFKFSAPGVREFDGTNAGYFSIDGGTTNLNDFNTSTIGNFGDWAASAGNDSFLAFSPSGVVNFVSLTDLRVMDVIGWQVAETAPAVAALTLTVGEDGPTFSQGLLAGASDADNDILFTQNLDASVTTVSTSAFSQTLFLGSDYTLSGSTISLTSTGLAKFNGLSLGEHDTATFNYGVSDGITTTPNTFTLTINGLNDDPSAAAIAGSASEDGPAVTLLADFTDPDRDDTHSFSIDTTGTKGSVTNNNDGTFSYDPNGQFDSLGLGQTATDTFAYTVADNHGASSTATVTVTINGLPDEPVSLPSIVLSKSVEILGAPDHKQHHHGHHGKGDDHDDGVNANVAYTFEVRNTSADLADAGLKLLSLIDDNGTPNEPADDFNIAALPKAFTGGDSDRDDLLDVGEVWTFRSKDTVQLKPGTEIVNTAVASARDADGNLATSVDQATIVTDDVLIPHMADGDTFDFKGQRLEKASPDDGSLALKAEANDDLTIWANTDKDAKLEKIAVVKDFFTESTDPPADPHINSEELFGSLGEDAAGIAQAAILFARKRLAGYHLTTFEPSIRHGIGVGDYTDKKVLGFSAPHLQCRDSAPSPALAVAQGEPSRVSSPAR